MRLSTGSSAVDQVWAVACSGHSIQVESYSAEWSFLTLVGPQYAVQLKCGLVVQELLGADALRMLVRKASAEDVRCFESCSPGVYLPIQLQP